MEHNLKSWRERAQLHDYSPLIETRCAEVRLLNTRHQAGAGAAAPAIGS